MMQKKSRIDILLKAVVSVIIALLLIIPTTSVSMDLTKTDISSKIDNVLSLGESGDSQGIQIEPSLHLQIPKDDCPSKLNDDIILTDWLIGNSSLPSLTQDNMGHTVATWTYDEPGADGSMMGILYATNTSDPSDWDGITLHFTGYSGTYWDTAWVEGPEVDDFKGLYGVNLYFNVNLPVVALGDYRILDITDDYNLWEFNIYSPTWFLEPTYSCIEDNCWYYNPTVRDYGVTNILIHRYYSPPYDIPDCPSYRIHFFDEDRGISYLDGQSRLLTAPASDPDVVNLPGRFHLTWQYHNQTTDIDQIVWKKIDPEIEQDIEYTPFQQYIADGTNPAIAAYDPGYVAVVYMDQGAVKCLYSSDDGETWATNTITDQGTYPDIYAAGEKLYSTYITDGNLYLVNSTDGGVTWGTSTQINDVDGTVVEEENSVDIHEGGIVWIDSQAGKKEVLYTDAEISPNLFIRGDVKADGEITIGDAMHILKHLYVPGWPEPTCLDTVDVNDDGNITMDDAIYLMRHLYIPNAPQPPEPFPNCGPDPTPDEINCNGHLCNG